MINAKRKERYIQTLDQATTELAEKFSRVFVYNADLLIIREDNTYTITSVDNEVYYEGIHFFTVAHALAAGLEQNINMNQILLYEQRFVKHLTDMTFYRNAEKFDLHENSRFLALEYLWKIKNFTTAKNYGK